MKQYILIITLTVAGFCNAQSQNTNYVLNNNILEVPNSIVFKTGSDELTTESSVAIQYVANYLKEKTYITLMRVEGHVSTEANETKNNDLAKKRAMAICKKLISLGVECERLLPVTYGSYKPIDTNSTAEGKQKNTRIAFVNAQLRGKSIGGMPIDGGAEIAGDPCVK